MTPDGFSSRPVWDGEEWRRLDFGDLTPKQEEHRCIQELCRIKGELGRTGRYGVYFDLTGPEIEFWVEEFGKPDFLLHIKHQDAGTVLEYVRKGYNELNLLSTP